jgi:hypothetical protein
VNPIKTILVGLPTIDRDADVFKYVSKNLAKSSKYLLSKIPTNISLTFVAVCRKADTQIKKLWENVGVKTLIVDNYHIDGRHNFNQMAKTFNILAKKAEQYDALFILESDILLNEKTMFMLYKKLYTNHVSLAYFDVPWCDYPVTLVPGVIPKLKNADDFTKDMLILGHGTGAIMIRSEVFQDCKFSHKKIFGIDGQDVGFFMDAFKNKYKIIMINDKVKHLYNR